MTIRKQLYGDENKDLGQQGTEVSAYLLLSLLLCSKVVQNRAIENEEITVILRVQISQVQDHIWVLRTESSNPNYQIVYWLLVFRFNKSLNSLIIC